MIFSSTFSADIMNASKRFTLLNLMSLPSKRTGVYLLTYKKYFIYVGKSSAQSGIKERLISHYNTSHNDRLNTWVSALDGNMAFTYLTCQNHEVDDLEKSLILHLQPITNEIRYRRYTPNAKKWRKSNG